MSAVELDLNLSDYDKTIILESGIIAFVLAVTVVLVFLGINTYQELKIENQRAGFEGEVYGEYRGSFEIECGGGKQHLIAERNGVKCWSRNFNVSRPANTSFRGLLEIKLIDRGTGETVDKDTIVSISNDSYVFLADQAFLEAVKPGNYKLELDYPRNKSLLGYRANVSGYKLENSILADPRYLDFYTRSQIETNNYRLAIIGLEILVWATLVIESTSLILRLRDRREKRQQKRKYHIAS